MGFSAMLAEEYILIDLSLISCSLGWTNKAEQQNIFNCINFTQQQFGLKKHRISAQQKALDVSGNSVRSSIIIDNRLNLLVFCDKNWEFQN
jgi:hypothetical protein